MKFPSSLIIGPHQYKIVDFAPGEAEAQHLNGRIVHQSLKIELDNTMAVSLKAETLLHEAFHGIWRFCNLPKRGEETVVTTLSPAFLLFCRANPGMKGVLFPP